MDLLSTFFLFPLTETYNESYITHFKVFFFKKTNKNQKIQMTIYKLKTVAGPERGNEDICPTQNQRTFSLF